jgi:HSP20 family protein
MRARSAAHGAWRRAEGIEPEVNMLPLTRNRGSAVNSLLGMSREMDQLMQTMWPEVENGATWAMPTEVIETDEELRFAIELPGFRSEDLEITLENNVLTVSGEKKLEREAKDSDYRLFERRYGRYQRSFTVPPTVRADATEARYENGVLSLRLPKAEEAKPRRIRVEPGAGARSIESSTNG